MSIAPNTTTASSTVTATAMTFAHFGQPARHEASSESAKMERQNKLPGREVQKVVRELNSALQPFNTELSFTVDKETDSTVIKIVDSETQEVVRQIPAEEQLRIASRIRKLLGLLIDGNA